MIEGRWRPGDTAPDFALRGTGGETVRLSDILRQGRKAVVYFYPKDNTPGCTVEARDFSLFQPEFEKAGAVVVGISMDSCASHERFREKHRLTLRLLSDPGGEVHEAYGVLRGGWLGIGRTPLAVVRSTFLIDESGKFLLTLYGVWAKGHVSDLLRRLPARS